MIVKEFIKVVTSGNVMVDAHSVECIFRADIKEFNAIVRKAIQNDSFIDYTASRSEIKSLLKTDSGMLYASAYKPETIISRLERADVYMISTIGTHSFLNAKNIEGLLKYEGDAVEDEGYQNIYIDDTLDDTAQPIRALIYLKNKHIYPSTFNLRTLKKRIEEVS